MKLPTKKNLADLRYYLEQKKLSYGATASKMGFSFTLIKKWAKQYQIKYKYIHGLSTAPKAKGDVIKPRPLDKSSVEFRLNNMPSTRCYA